MGASSDVAAAVTLAVVSLLCFLVAAIFRKWPERVRECVEGIDGSLLLLTREAHRAVITTSAWALTLMSLAALVAAALVL